MRNAERSKKRKQNLDLHRLVGSLIDQRLRVLRLVQASPKGWLYEVEPPGVGQTRRALKVIGSPAAREPSAQARLNLLVNRLPLIKDRGLEQVFELGWLSDQTPYLVTEWSGASSLYERLRRKGAFSWAEALPILVKLAESISVLHKAGFPHGDIRAQHVLLGEENQPLLIDGVIAATINDEPSGGLEQGPAYLAPERHHGPATFASDSYAFGILAWQLLTGHLPFRGDGGDEDPLLQLRLQHEREPLPDLPAQACPEYVQALIQRLTAKSPRARPTQFLELAKRLRSSGQARPSSDSKRTDEVLARPSKEAKGSRSASQQVPSIQEEDSLSTDLLERSKFSSQSSLRGWLSQRWESAVGEVEAWLWIATLISVVLVLWGRYA